MSIANSFAKKRRAPIEQAPPSHPTQYNPNAFRNGPAPAANGPAAPAQSGFTLPQVIALIDKRLVTIERQMVDLKDTVPQGNVSEQFAQDKVSVDDFQTVLKEFNDRFEMLADEFANYKNSMMTLQSFTMEVNQKLVKQLEIANSQVCKCASRPPPLHVSADEQYDMLPPPMFRRPNPVARNGCGSDESDDNMFSYFSADHHIPVSRQKDFVPTQEWFDPSYHEQRFNSTQSIVMHDLEEDAVDTDAVDTDAVDTSDVESFHLEPVVEPKRPATEHRVEVVETISIPSTKNGNHKRNSNPRKFVLDDTKKTE